MKTTFRHRWTTRTSVAVIGLGFGAGLFWFLVDGIQTEPSLRFNRVGQSSTGDLQHDVVRHNSVVADGYQKKYDPRRRVDFHVTSSRDTAIFVLATGVEIQTPSGWKVVLEEPRNEIWRMKSGLAREVYVDGQPRETWRAFVRCGTEMKGPAWLWAKLRDAWRTLSFSNRTVKSWGGGGPWSGSYELFSEEIEDDTYPRLE